MSYFDVFGFLWLASYYFESNNHYSIFCAIISHGHCRFFYKLRYEKVVLSKILVKCVLPDSSILSKYCTLRGKYLTIK